MYVVVLLLFFNPKLVPKENNILERKPGVFCGGTLPLQGGHTDPHMASSGGLLWFHTSTPRSHRCFSGEGGGYVNSRRSSHSPQQFGALWCGHPAVPGRHGEPLECARKAESQVPPYTCIFTGSRVARVHFQFEKSGSHRSEVT